MLGMEFNKAWNDFGMDYDYEYNLMQKSWEDSFFNDFPDYTEEEIFEGKIFELKSKLFNEYVNLKDMVHTGNLLEDAQWNKMVRLGKYFKNHHECDKAEYIARGQGKYWF